MVVEQHLPGAWAIFEPLIFMVVTYVAIVGYWLTLCRKGTTDPSQLWDAQADRSR